MQYVRWACAVCEVGMCSACGMCAGHVRAVLLRMCGSAYPHGKLCC